MNEPPSALRGALWLAFAFACEAASAQSAIAPSAAASAAERAQKETDRTMYWIRVLADRPAPVKAVPAPAAPKAATAAAAAPPPVAKPVVEAREKPKSVVAPAATTAATGKPSTPALAPGLDTSEPTSALSSSSADKAAAATAVAAHVAPPPQPAAAAAPLPADEPDAGLTQIKSVRPEFPGRVVLRVHKGHVEVRFEVEPGGTVTEATVVSTSDAHLNQAAIDAVKEWRFKPSSRYHTAAVDLAFDIDKE